MTDVIDVRIDGDEIVFGDEIYYIDLTSCTSWEDIVGWSLQLSGKTWVDTNVIHKFIVTAMQVNNLEWPSLR